MSLEAYLAQRAQGVCELCDNTGELAVLHVPDGSPDLRPEDRSLLACRTCRYQILGLAPVDPSHWHVLTESMWSETPAIQISAYYMLTRLSGEPWARDALEALFLDEIMMAWIGRLQARARRRPTHHVDCDKMRLFAGDTVEVIKDLPLKRGGFAARRGDVAQSITLTKTDFRRIEGVIDGRRTALLASYVRKWR
ncbi:MAG: PhnA domain-containing protein [Pseudomonadota bacterium]